MKVVKLIFQSSKLENQLLEVELKLFSSCKRLRFSVEVQQPVKQLLGHSVEFSAHNSGGGTNLYVHPTNLHL